MGKYTAIGGQALIEGIMMKSPEKTALAVRTPDKSIDITYLNEKSLRQKYKIFKLPVLRGIVAFVESMIQGYKAMMLSADKSGFTDIEEENEKNDQNKKQLSEKSKNLIVTIIMIIGTILGVALAVVLFMGIPRYVVSGLSYLFKTDLTKLGIGPVIEQIIKLVVFVSYIYLVSLMKDIKRVFMYHGAEHKTIFCYEKGLPLTVDNVRTQRRFHPRCGTSFLILMILVSVIISILVQAIFPQVYSVAWAWVIVKILLVPIICGVGFEVLRACGKYDNLFTKIVSAPGLWLQRLTTKEPEDDMIEIAIAALKACEPEVPDVERPEEKNLPENDISENQE